MQEVAKRVAEFKENQGFVVGGLDFNGDGTQLATAGQVAPPEVHIWSWRAPNRISRVLELTAPAGGGEAIRYSPDGGLLAVGHMRDSTNLGVVRIWNTVTWDVVHDIVEPQGGSVAKGLAFSQDGKFLVRTLDRVAGPNLIVHRTDTWEATWALGPTSPFIPRTLALSPDGRYAAMGGISSSMGPNGRPPIALHPQILLVDLVRKEVTQTIAAFPDSNEVEALAWSPNGKWIAAGALVTESAPGPDGMKVFDAATGQRVSGDPAKSAYVSGLRYSPDGRYVVSGYLDASVHIWDGQHEKLLQTIPVNDHFHTALAISHDGRLLAIASGTDVSIWELK